MGEKNFYPLKYIEKGSEKITKFNDKYNEVITKFNDKYNEVLGWGIIAKFYGPKISYVKEIEPTIEEVIKKSMLNAIEKKYHQFYPVGVTGFVLLEESHIAIHSWPEKDYLLIDISTCGKNAKKKAEKAYKIFKESLKPNKIEKIVFPFGI